MGMKEKVLAKTVVVDAVHQESVEGLTGETTSSVGVMKVGTCKSSEPLLVDTLTTGTAEKVYTEDHGGEEQSGTKVFQSPLLSSGKALKHGRRWELSDAQSGARMLLPVGVNDTVIPVYDDEPNSVLYLCTSLSSDYHAQLSDELEKSKDATLDSNFSFQSLDSSNLQSPQSVDETVLESYRKSFGSMDESLCPCPFLAALLIWIHSYNKRLCMPEDGFLIRSLSRCKKWGAQGGKSNVFFAKTLDDRFIIKQVTKTELESFMKFAPAYFKYLSESIISGSPTCLAKILGIYQVSSKHLKGGKESKMDVQGMENLLFGRNLTRLL
ncbi:hypothetical protein HAX54_025548 [Datura stramonium]|uniref:PIPK domain-containing protein n=1 Tax=Datura stramonium TaxID=4076 RepID=A0ABS8S6M4_DATST|nr:hypothetical protein [Datura stramonium]